MALLDLPDERSIEWYGCGPAAARCVLGHFGRPLTVADRLMPTPTQGTSPRQLSQTFRLADLLVVEGFWTIQSVSAMTSVGWPVIACVQESDGFDHYVVVRGVFRGLVYYQCPDQGPSRQRVDGFLSRWHSEGPRGVILRRFGIAVGSSS